MNRFAGIMVVTASVALASAAFAADVEKGKEAFKTNKCAMCHSIAGAGGKMKALDGVGARLKADQIKKWVTAPTEVKADTKKKPLKVADADLENITAYLLTLK